MFWCRITWGMDTAHTSNDNPAEIAALFAYLDAPAEKVAPVAPVAEAVKRGRAHQLGVGNFTGLLSWLNNYPPR